MTKITIIYDGDEWNEFIINEFINWQQHDIIKDFKINGKSQIGHKDND